MKSIAAPNKAISILSVLIITLSSHSIHAGDTDSDGVSDSTDNCSQISNPQQIDADNDGFGNRCDPDLDNSGIVNFGDVLIFSGLFLGTDPVADFNSDGSVNFSDFALIPAFFLLPPGPGAVPPAPPTYTSDVQPILFAKCAPCHTGLGIGGHDIGIVYADALIPAGNFSCSGLNVGECSLLRIQNGEMPQGAGCTGDPALDAGNNDCLTAEEQSTVQAWLDAGLPE